MTPCDQQRAPGGHYLFERHGAEVRCSRLARECLYLIEEKDCNQRDYNAKDGSNADPKLAAVAYDPLQAEWVTGKGAFVRTSLSNQAHYGEGWLG